MGAEHSMTGSVVGSEWTDSEILNKTYYELYKAAYGRTPVDGEMIDLTTVLNDVLELVYNYQDLRDS